jgi:nicotinamidase/pyrazinamidase
VARYDTSTALVVVDLQNDFADPRGALAVPGGDEVVPIANREIERAVQAGALVVYTQDWHPPSTPHFAEDGGLWPVHCVQGSWGAELVPALKVTGPVVRKGVAGEDGYSGFSVRDPLAGTEAETELAALLHDRGVKRVVVLGLATDYCVKETALDAARLGFSTSVVTEGTRSVNLVEGDGSRALEQLARAGVNFI